MYCFYRETFSDDGSGDEENEYIPAPTKLTKQQENTRNLKNMKKQAPDVVLKERTSTIRAAHIKMKPNTLSFLDKAFADEKKLAELNETFIKRQYMLLDVNGSWFDVEVGFVGEGDVVLFVGYNMC